MLEVRTLIFAVVAANVICFLAITMLYFSRVPVKGPLSWGIAKLSTILGLVLLFLRGYTTDFFSIVVANGFLILGAIFEWHGFRQFLGITRYGITTKALMWVSVPLIMMAQYWYSDLDPTLWLRRVFISFLLSLFSLLVVRDLLKSTQKTSAFKLAIMVYLSHSAIMTFNLITSVIERPAIEQLFLASSMHNSFLFLYSMLSAILGTFTMILIISQELQKRLEKQATLDPLTEVYNRLALDMFGEHAFAHMKRSKEPLAALMIDLDHFKKINDQRGHAIGDQLLSHFAQLVKEVIRSEDLLFRYGGEEFVVLVPVASRDGCISLAERIRLACQSSPLITDKEYAYFSVSIGLALAGPQDKGVYDSINRADEAMYEAKNAGRNKVAVYDPGQRDGFYFPGTFTPLD